MKKLKPIIDRTILRAKRTAKEKNWKKADVWDLVTTADIGMMVMCAEYGCLPREIVSLCPPVLLRMLYYQELMVRAIEKGENPYIPIFMAEYLRESVGPAWREIYRRGQKHISFHAAMYLHLSFADSIAGKLMEPLVKLARNKVSPWLQKEIPGQIALTLKERWGDLYWTELFARALNGEMDVFPTAVRDGLIRAKTEESQPWIDVTFQYGRELEDPRPQERKRGAIQVDDTRGPDEIDPWELRKRLIRTPLTRRISKAVERAIERGDTISTKNIAKWCNISTRWVKFGKKQAREILQNYREELEKKKKN